MFKKSIFGVFAALTCCAVVACGANDGLNGKDGVSVMGPAGVPGQDGDRGETVVGAPGKDGKDGDAGEVGDIACGDDLIKASEWHTVCGSSVGACKQGQVQCRLFEREGELMAHRVCYGEVKPAERSGKCWMDTDCDGVKDDTNGEGDNVTFVKQAFHAESFLSGSSRSFDITLSEGRCRNAKKHCLGSDAQDTCWVDSNGMGVVWSDFVADPKEGEMGWECVDGQSVRTWECVVGQDGVARVKCEGPLGL